MICAGQKHEGGFSLLELLVAVTLLALLSLVLFGSLKFGRQVWKTAAEGTMSTNRVRDFRSELRDDIARIHPLFVADPQQSRLDFDGERQQVMFLAPSPDGGLERFVVGGSGDAIMIAGRPELANATVPTYVRSLGGVRDAQFAYFGRLKGDKTAVWHDAWRGQTRLPMLIRISAVADKAVGWSTIVVAPHIAADPSCSYDPTTGFCHGR